jgi:hypothetical protein
LTGVLPEGRVDIKLKKRAVEESCPDGVGQRIRHAVPVLRAVSDPGKDVVIAMAAREPTYASTARLRTGTASMIMVDRQFLGLAGRDPTDVAPPALEFVEEVVHLLRDSIGPLNVEGVRPLLSRSLLLPVVRRAPGPRKRRGALRAGLTIDAPAEVVAS